MADVMADHTVSREIQELSLLFEISKKLSETLDLKRVLKPVLQMMAEHMEMLRGTLTILNRKRGEIIIEEAFGLRPEEQAKGQVPHGRGYYRHGDRYRTACDHPADFRRTPLP